MARSKNRKSLLINEVNTITVVQGEMHISNSSADVLSTVLGSCVAVCLWDAECKVGGMNHFLLPGESTEKSGLIKYGAHAMEVLINGLLKSGASRSALKAKFFGGASMMDRLGNIGENNVRFARTFLKAEGIPCVAESVGGTEARRLLFWPTTGQARLRIVPRYASEKDIRSEQAYGKKKDESVILF